MKRRTNEVYEDDLEATFQAKSENSTKADKGHSQLNQRAKLSPLVQNKARRSQGQICDRPGW